MGPLKLRIFCGLTSQSQTIQDDEFRLFAVYQKFLKTAGVSLQRLLSDMEYSRDTVSLQAHSGKDQVMVSSEAVMLAFSVVWNPVIPPQIPKNFMIVYRTVLQKTKTKQQNTSLKKKPTKIPLGL